jgi:predicted AAA+ superfamily ATPase
VGGKFRRSHYLTFDNASVLEFANSNPDTFLLQFADFSPLILDEAQRVAPIFRAIKYSVDENRVPGKYLLLGSTEFSRMQKIKESLTGRMTRIRLFPFNLGESLKLNAKDISRALFSPKPRCTRKDLLRYLESGGFPAIFSVRDDTARQSLLEDWIDLTISRDAKQFPGLKVDSLLLRRILQTICQHEEPTAGNISRTLGKNLRAIQAHLKILMELFVIHPLAPFTGSAGKTLYFVCDLGIADYFKASFEKKLWTWALLETLSQSSNAGIVGQGLFFYRTPKGKFIHLVLERRDGLYGIKIHAQDGINLRDFESLKSFLSKFPNAQASLLGPTRISHPELGMQCYPWESLC